MPPPAPTYGVTAAGIQARLLISRPRGVRANLTLPLKFISRRLVVCVIGSRWLSTKSRYSESLLDFEKSNPATMLARGVMAKSMSMPIAGALKSLRSTVSWSWTNVKRSLLALANIHPLRTPTVPRGLPKRKSGDVWAEADVAQTRSSAESQKRGRDGPSTHRATSCCRRDHPDKQGRHQPQRRCFVGFARSFIVLGRETGVLFGRIRSRMKARQSLPVLRGQYRPSAPHRR